MGVKLTPEGGRRGREGVGRERLDNQGYKNSK